MRSPLSFVRTIAVCSLFWLGPSYWMLRVTNQLFLDLLLKLFAYCSALSLDEGYSHPMDIVSSPNLQCCPSCLSYTSPARASWKLCRDDSRIESGAAYSIVMPSPIISFVERADVCAIPDSSGYDMATALVAWKVMRPAA